MTIATTLIRRSVFGNMKVVIGSCTNDSTGGDVDTTLSVVELFIPINLGGTAAELSVNESFPVASGTITVVTENAVNFAWIAFGR